MQEKKLLIVSYQSELLAQHSEALSDSGFSVLTASSLSAGLGAVGPGNIDLLILAPGIPAGDRRRIEAEAKRRNSKIRIVLLYSGAEEKDIFANSILNVADAPEVLVEAARQLLAA